MLPQHLSPQSRAVKSVKLINKTLSISWPDEGVDFVDAEDGEGKFYANIAPPTVEFLCNEELVLFIKLTCFNLDAPEPPKLANKKGVTIPFLVRFTSEIEEGKTKRSAPTGTEVYTLILDSPEPLTKGFEGFTASLGYGGKADASTLLLDYVKKYLRSDFINDGHDVLKGLPDKDADKETTAQIDYTLCPPPSSRGYINSVHGVHVDAINEYIHTLWEKRDLIGNESFLRALLKTEQIFKEHGKEFQLKGQPHVKALCTKEVILYIGVQELKLSGESDAQTWGLTFISAVTYEVVDEVTTLNLDLSKYPLRFRGNLSKDDKFTTLQPMGKFLERKLNDEITQQQCTVIYKPTPVISTQPSDLGIESVTEFSSSDRISWSTYRKKISAEFVEFDSVTTVSQESINSHFTDLFGSSAKNASVLTKWSYKDESGISFIAEFEKAPRVQLILSESSKAILYFFVRDGHLRPGTRLKRERQPNLRGLPQYKMSGCRIAIEVDLEVDRSSAPQVVLGFSNGGRLRTEFSYLRGAEGWQKDTLVTLNTIMADYYARELKESHLLFGIPVSTQTNLDLRVAPLSNAAGAAVLQEDKISLCNDFAIIILEISRVESRLQRASIETGAMIATQIPRQLFLDSALHVLEHVNKKTAIVTIPNFARLNGGESFLQLSVVQEDFVKNARAFAWTQLAPEDGCLQYEWVNFSDWRYEHVSRFVCPEIHGSYSAKLATHNRLRIPIDSIGDDSCMIGVYMRVTLDVTRDRAGNGDWRGHVGVQWAENVKLSGTATGGLAASITPFNDEKSPRVTGPTFHGESGETLALWNKIVAQFNELTENINFDGVASGLQNAINRVWVGSNECIIKKVMFREDGGLLLESGRGKPSTSLTVPSPSGNVAAQGRIGGDYQNDIEPGERRVAAAIGQSTATTRTTSERRIEIARSESRSEIKTERGAERSAERATQRTSNPASIMSTRSDA